MFVLAKFNPTDPSKPLFWKEGRGKATDGYFTPDKQDATLYPYYNEASRKLERMRKSATLDLRDRAIFDNVLIRSSETEISPPSAA